MPVLHLNNVPENLLRRISELASTRNVAVEAETVRLLERAVAQELPRSDQVEGSGRARTVQEVLDEIARNRMRPDPDGPTVVEMLREDRDR